MRRHVKIKLVVAHALLLAGAGCGLLDLASFHGVTFQLPSKSYSVSTTDPRWKGAPPGGIPPLSCGPTGAIPDCCKPGGGITIDCLKYPLKCDTGGFCAISFSYEIAQVIDLAKEVPDLGQVKGSLLTKVLLKTISITIDNSLNMATPPVDLYVAPKAVTSGTDPKASKIGTIPSKPAGFKGTETITVQTAAQEAFSTYAKDFQTPFNILAATSVLVKSGSPTPMGKLDLTMTGTVEAQF